MDSAAILVFILSNVILWYFLLKKVRFFWFFSSKEKNVCYISRLPVVRGKGSTSRMFAMPVTYITMRSKPRP